jgi:hypothetical protein
MTETRWTTYIVHFLRLLFLVRPNCCGKKGGKHRER